MMKTKPVDEGDYLPRFLRGEEAALDYLVERHASLVAGIVRQRLTAFPGCWDECINDVFLAVWQHRADYDKEKGSLSAWIAAIARFKAIDTLRRHWRSQQDLPLLEGEGGPSVSGPEETLLDSQLSNELEALLSHLSPQDQQLFIEHYVQQQDLLTLSRRHGLSLSALYSRFSRGKRKLRKEAELTQSNNDKRSILL